MFDCAQDVCDGMSAGKHETVARLPKEANEASVSLLGKIL